jgi:AbrB family looped-hinge helix DNA binding protein
MQKEAKITAKGQITVPREVRRVLGVKAGDRLVFEHLKMENGETDIRLTQNAGAAKAIMVHVVSSPTSLLERTPKSTAIGCYRWMSGIIELRFRS